MIKLGSLVLLVLLADCKTQPRTEEQLVRECQYRGGSPNVSGSFKCEMPEKKTQLSQQTERF